MFYQIQQPQLIEIRNERGNRVTYGPNQSWYSDNWRKKSGCGPTAASLLTAYYAWTRPELKALYPYETANRADFTQHMERLFEFVTPGFMGLNRTSMFVEGVQAYAASVGVQLVPHVFDVQPIKLFDRASPAEMAEFVSEALTADSPLAMLALATGDEKRLQDWHWITLTGAEITDEQIIATATDEGKKKQFDLTLWYHTTPLCGGLIWFGA